jgi:NodT family efflux transporter outer membrane factor (OMF) lipoprotein
MRQKPGQPVVTSVAASIAAIVLGLSLVVIAGCSNARPKYIPPVSAQMSQSQSWSTQLAGGETATPASDHALSQWWAALNDPLLTSLEERAVKGNLDLKKAEAVIRQVRAQRNYAQLGMLPTVTGNASANGGHTGGSNGGPSGTTQMSALSIDASWEPDFFGRLRGTVNAYEADLGGAEESLRDVLVSLTAEVALNYVSARSYQAQIAVTEANLKSFEQTYEVTLAQYQSGLATELDAAQARMNVQSTRATLPSLEGGLQSAVNHIAVLLGERPGAVNAELAEVRPVPSVPLEVAVGVPADLLRRRPDIRNAERQVAAQTARLGVSKADLYPTFTLSGSLGLSSEVFSKLFTPDALLASIAGAVQHTIFDRRKIRENIKVQDAVLDQNVTAYESTVLTAMEDVENALLAFAKEQARRQSLAEASVAAAQASQIANDLYASGLKDFLNVLDAERSLLNLQNELAQSDATITADLIRLYKALGGGWDSSAANSPATPGVKQPAASSATESSR